MDAVVAQPVPYDRKLKPRPKSQAAWRCLSKCLNWSFISRQVDVFCSQTLPSGAAGPALASTLSKLGEGRGL